NCDGNYTIERTWYAEDNCGNVSSGDVQTITVVDTTEPTVTLPADARVDCSGDTTPSGTGMASATDDCSGVLEVTFSDNVIPGNCDGNYTIERTWYAEDNCGNTSSGDVQTITVVDSTAPSVTPPADAQVDCSGDTSPSSTGTAQATDDCSGVLEVTFSDSTVPGDCVGSYTILRTWYAEDNCGNTSSGNVQTITVVDSTAPTVTPPADVQADCTADLTPTGTGQASATDDCSGVLEVTFSDSIVPGDCEGNYTILRTWYAEDNCGNISSGDLQTITVVDNTDPVITGQVPADTTVQCIEDVPPAVPLAAYDSCDSSVTEATPSDSDPVGDPCLLTITRTWTVADCSGNTSSVSQVITVQDTTPPSVSAPQNVVFYICDAENPCPTIDELPDPTPEELEAAFALDNCDGELTVLYEDGGRIGLLDCEEQPLEPSCPVAYERVWYAIDECGNRGEAVQQFICISSNEITDSSLCLFDRYPECDEPGQQFRVIFTPDTMNQPWHMISSTNPGQFFYNVFYLGSPGDIVSLEVCLPFPFTTKGANPIHIYDTVSLEQCGYGVAFIPSGEFYANRSQIVLQDYLPDTPLPPNVQYQFPDACFAEIQFTVPDTGFAYLNIHLEYGVVHMGDFDQDVRQNAVDPRSKLIYLFNNNPHYFSFTGGWINQAGDQSGDDLGGSSVAYNVNDFQVSAGVTGVVTDSGGSPVAGATLTMTAGNRRRSPVNFTVMTDSNGEYFIPYVHQGTPTAYDLYMDYAGEQQWRKVFLKNNGLAVEDFTVGD
ncbi:MAG: carboxypeptidase regulatory-like domain-containing protein, partial [Puniceicoccaceae bacterium]